MKAFITTLVEAKEVQAYLEAEFGDSFECCGVVMPPTTEGIELEVTEPLECPFHTSRTWGTINLPEDGCIPVGRYRVMHSRQKGHSQHFIDLVPLDGGPRITACSGYANRMIIDWRGAKNIGKKVELTRDQKLAKMRHAS